MCYENRTSSKAIDSLRFPHQDWLHSRRRFPGYPNVSPTPDFALRLFNLTTPARRQHRRRAPTVSRARQVRRIDRVLQLDMGIFKLKFSMNFLMNFCSHLQVVAALLIGGWMVHTDQLEMGGVVAFISAIGG